MSQARKLARAGGPDALPNATIGHRLTAMTSWLHYGLGLSIEQVRSILFGHLRTDLTNSSAEWQAFAKQLRRLNRDGIRLRKRPDLAPDKYARRIDRIDARLMALAHGSCTDADASRLAARLLKYCDSLFTFLDHPLVPFDNNLADPGLPGPAVLIRRNSQSNRSDKGAATQAVLMSIYRTLKLRGHNPSTSLPTPSAPTWPPANSPRCP